MSAGRGHNVSYSGFIFTRASVSRSLFSVRLGLEIRLTATASRKYKERISATLRLGSSVKLDLLHCSSETQSCASALPTGWRHIYRTYQKQALHLPGATVQEIIEKPSVTRPWLTFPVLSPTGSPSEPRSPPPCSHHSQRPCSASLCV